MFRIFDDGPSNVRAKIIGIYAILIGANLAAWGFAFQAFHDYPVLLGTALLAYTLGLRHAVDPDHIAAIDNVTRKLIQDGKQPIAVGFFFSLGHSSVVWLASIAVALTATAFKDQISSIKDTLGIVGTLVSTLFLLAIGFVNIVILAEVYRAFRRVMAGGGYVEDDLNARLAQGGLFARILRPLFRLIRHSWQMYPLGFLFGLGFDTATEIALIGISAAGAAQGLSIWTILIFPALFTAGMSLVDTTDGVLMLRAYGWAFIKPIRKLYYNLTMTFVSVLVALMLGALQGLNLIGDKLELKGTFWETIAAINDSFGLIGYIIIGAFIAIWGISYIIYRWRGFERFEVALPNS